MRVFVTGATGFIGTEVVRELQAAGHSVLGLARDPDKATTLAATGAEMVMGTLEDPAPLGPLAASCDGVIHLAFSHDFSRFAENCAMDEAAINAMGTALAGSGKPLIVTGGLAGLAPPGEPVTETHLTPADYAFPRRSEQAGFAFVAKDVRAIAMRLPQVHDTRRQGLVSPLIETARAKGFLGYIGEGANRWPAAHVSDVARLYLLALEQSAAGTIVHAVDEEGVALRAICDTLSARLDLPARALADDEVADYYGWLAGLAGADMTASSAVTRKTLGWTPNGPGMLADLARLEI